MRARGMLMAFGAGLVWVSVDMATGGSLEG